MVRDYFVVSSYGDCAVVLDVLYLEVYIFAQDKCLQLP